jgi:hypothetical protein
LFAERRLGRYLEKRGWSTRRLSFYIHDDLRGGGEYNKSQQRRTREGVRLSRLEFMTSLSCLYFSLLKSICSRL